MSWTRWLELEGTIETVEELNREYMRETGSDEPYCDDDSEGWREWIEHDNGKTYILADISGRKEIEELEKRYGRRNP